MNPKNIFKIVIFIAAVVFLILGKQIYIKKQPSSEQTPHNTEKSEIETTPHAKKFEDGHFPISFYYPTNWSLKYPPKQDAGRWIVEISGVEGTISVSTTAKMSYEKYIEEYKLNQKNPLSTCSQGLGCGSYEESIYANQKAITLHPGGEGSYYPSVIFPELGVSFGLNVEFIDPDTNTKRDTIYQEILNSIKIKPPETAKRDFWIIAFSKLKTINIDTGVVTDWLTYPGQGPNSDGIILSPQGNSVVYYGRSGEEHSIILYDLNKKTEKVIATGIHCTDGPCVEKDEDLKKIIGIGGLSEDGKYLSFYDDGKSYLLDTQSFRRFVVDNLTTNTWTQPVPQTINLASITGLELSGSVIFPSHFYDVFQSYLVGSQMLLSYEHIDAKPDAKGMEAFGGARLVLTNKTTGERKVILEDKLNRFFLLGPKD